MGIQKKPIHAAPQEAGEEKEHKKNKATQITKSLKTEIWFKTRQLFWLHQRFSLHIKTLHNMRKIISSITLIACLQAKGQDTTMNNLTRDMDGKDEKPAVRIFDSERLINTYTTEVVGKGKMDFRVIHNFYDVAGKFGGVRNFFGLDAAADIKIGFEIGLGKRTDLILARVRGGENYHNVFSRVSRILELGLKYKLLEQKENDPSHPLSMALFGNIAASTMTAPTFSNQNLADSAETNFENFSDRMSQTLQLIIAKKIQKISLQVSGTLVHRNRVITGDQNTIFALGFAARIPISNTVAIIFDYIHPFHTEKTEQFFKTIGPTVPQVVKFYDPLGIGFEIKTSGHVFHLNFTNATEILENRMIPRTVTSWGKGQFRWGFTISRTFVLWRDKSM
jgi:hypothetical protein